MSDLKKVSLVAFASVWLLLFLAGLQSYIGNTVVYIMFSAVFLLLLASAFRNQRTYAYVYMAILIWLGFWLKVTYHALFPYPFVEPTGQFSWSAESWDEVLLVATAAAAGILLSGLLFNKLARHKRTTRGEYPNIPGWLLTNGRWHLAFFLCVLLGVTFSNIYFGIFVIGFDVRTILPRPLNAWITLMLVGCGFVMWMASIIWWAVVAKRRLFGVLIVMVISGALITFSTLSRGLILFFTLPVLYAVYLNRDKVVDFSALKAVLVISAMGVGLVASFFAINQLRDRLYFATPTVNELPAHQYASSFVHFAIDRWVGIEGVMATAAYPDTGDELLIQALAEKPVQGHPTIYQTICPWPKSAQFDQLKKHVNLFSLPGGIGFLYYANSIFIVFAGAMIMGLALQYLEYCVFLLTGNPILCSALGWFMAISFAHFGGVPRNTVPVIVFQAMAVLGIWMIQSRFGKLVLRKMQTSALWRGA